MVDGDKSLVVSDKNIIDIAERNIKKYNIVPLYYNMKKAKPSVLNSKSIYEGLSSAFTGSNIGQYSNEITKIWNSEVFYTGTQKEKEDALNVIKYLVCENNFKIDYAKTLYMPERPKEIDKLIKKFTKKKLPHFFIYAKDKTKEQVEEINSSFVNKLNDIIENPRINKKYAYSDGKRKKIQKPDYKKLMYNPFFKNSLEATRIWLRYLELSKFYYFKVDATVQQSFTGEILMKSQIRKMLLYKKVIEETKMELSKFGKSDKEITDILVYHLYHIKDSKYKDLLWICYGDYILANLKRKIKFSNKAVQCVDCGEWFEVKSKYNSATRRCENCQKEREKERKRLWKRKYDQIKKEK